MVTSAKRKKKKNLSVQTEIATMMRNEIRDKIGDVFNLKMERIWIFKSEKQLRGGKKKKTLKAKPV